MNTELSQNRPQSSQDRLTTNSKNTPQRIFVHGLHPFTSEQDLFETFRPFCEIDELCFKRNPISGKHKGFAFFTVANKETAERLINSEHILHGRKIHCDYRNNDQSGKKRTSRKRVFIGGIPGKASDEDLTSFFAQFGKVRAAYAIKDLSGARKNYGYVDFYSEESSLEAVRASPVFIKGKKVDIRLYKKKGSKTSSRDSRRTPSSSSREREPSVHSFSSANTQPHLNSPKQIIGQSRNQDTFSPVQDRLQVNKTIFTNALPNFQDRPLGCFMNRKGEQAASLMSQFMMAMMNNDYVRARLNFEKIQNLKNQIFSGNYMNGIQVGISRDFSQTQEERMDQNNGQDWSGAW